MSQSEMTVTVTGALTADLLVDAHLRALQANASLRVVHDGEPTLVALRTAERFGIALERAAPIPPPSPPAPPVAPAPAPALPDDAMPWGAAPAAYSEPQPSAVEPIELLAFPWFTNPDPSEDHAEVTTGQRTRRAFADHPTSVAASWGLPWPRPGASTDALSLNDPRLWRSQERIQAVRDDLDKLGAPSFGASRPADGSAWLRKLPDLP